MADDTTQRGRATDPTVRIPVLMYHRVGVPHDADDATYCITAERFASHVQALADDGYEAVALETFVAWLADARVRMPAKPFVLTFDDGFADLHRHAWPMLRERAWPATVFLVAGLIGGHDRWMQRPGGRRPPTDLLDADQILSMANGGISFHSHSSNHLDLVALSDDVLVDEVAGSRRLLGELLGHPVDFFAYPFGRHDSRVVAAVKSAGYRAALSVLPGFNRRDVDPFRIRRLDVFGTDTARQLLRKIRLGSNDGSVTAAWRYYGRRLLSRASR